MEMKSLTPSNAIPKPNRPAAQAAPFASDPGLLLPEASIVSVAVPSVKP